MLDIYTDGSKMGQEAGWAAVFVRGNSEAHTIWGTQEGVDSNEIEVIAAYSAIKFIFIHCGLPTFRNEHIRLYSDNLNLVKILKSDMKHLSRLPLGPYQDYREVIFRAAKYYSFKVHHIPRMVKDSLHRPFHVKAHKIAKLAASGRDIREVYDDAEEFTNKKSRARAYDKLGCY